MQKLLEKIKLVYLGNISLKNSKNLHMNHYQQNRTRLANITGGLIVVPANYKMEMSLDTAYPFRQDSNFYYLTGVSEPGWILVIDKNNGDYLIAPKKSAQEILFDGENNFENISGISAVQNIYEHREGWEKLKKQIETASQIYLPVSSSKIDWQIAPNPSGVSLTHKVKTIKTSINVKDIKPNLAKMRSIKQDYEIDLLQKAVDSTCETLRNVRNNLKNFQNESELEAAITGKFAIQYGVCHAYEPIVASSKNATTIHYIKNDSEFRNGDLLLIDAGAYQNNYCGDISRTFSIGGDPSTRQRDIHEAVQSVLTKTLEILKPGISWRDYVAKVEKFMGEELVKLKLISSSESKKSIRKYFPHLISHSLGLDVHDPINFEDPISQNMVITVEPGIYVPEEGIGVRIEEDVLITKNGNKVLSSDLDTEL